MKVWGLGDKVQGFETRADNLRIVEFGWIASLPPCPCEPGCHDGTPSSGHFKFPKKPSTSFSEPFLSKPSTKDRKPLQTYNTLSCQTTINAMNLLYFLVKPHDPDHRTRDRSGGYPAVSTLGFGVYSFLKHF